MKQILVMMVAVVLVGCGKSEESPKATSNKLIADPIVEKGIRAELEKPTGELTKADLEKVTFLYLGNTKINDAGLKELAKLQKLEDLTLTGTKVTDVGLKEMAKLQKLETLDLNRTQITDAGLKEVAKLQQLKSLFLVSTQITEAGVAELKKALPKCDIS